MSKRMCIFKSKMLYSLKRRRYLQVQTCLRDGTRLERRPKQMQNAVRFAAKVAQLSSQDRTAYRRACRPRLLRAGEERSHVSEENILIDGRSHLLPEAFHGGIILHI